MPCYHPLKAIRGEANSDGKRPLLFSVKTVDGSSQVPYLLPCGQCIGCRLERSKSMAIRCMDESKMHEENSFITLTYESKFLPVDGSLVKRDFQLFVKRLRKEISKPIKYYACGEYGERFGRPHYHACIFGEMFRGRKFIKMSGAGFPVYSSPVLQKVWTYGYSSVSDFSFDTAAYVARYCCQKLSVSEGSSSLDVQRYLVKYLDKKTGVLREPEFNLISRGGRSGHGLGYSFYRRYFSDMFPAGLKVVHGVECKTPRYYDNLFQSDDPVGFDRLKRKRFSLTDVVESSMRRLLVKEEVTLSRISRLKRSFEYVEER